jgi:hypothetical protein
MQLLSKVLKLKLDRLVRFEPRLRRPFRASTPLQPPLQIVGALSRKFR